MPQKQGSRDELFRAGGRLGSRVRCVCGLSLMVALVLTIGGCRNRAGDASQPDSSGQSKPNIMLITVESIRADHVGCYGYDRPVTPHIDALARQATRYSRAHAVTSWTLTSHASMFTGLYPTAHQVVGPTDQLGDAYTTVAELLAPAGYQRAAVVSGPYLSRKHNLNQGFGLYNDSPITPGGDKAAAKDITNTKVEAGVNDFLRHKRSTSRPFFLFVYIWDPHYDYIPPPPFDQRFVPQSAEPIDVTGYEIGGTVTQNATPAQMDYVIAQYDGEIACTDAMLGRFWATLKELNLWDSTAILLTADHGESFFEHGTKGHKNDLYVESLHVPLIIKSPDQRIGRVDDRLVNLIDLHPTILELAGVDPGPTIHGRSILGVPRSTTDPVYFELETSWYFTRRTTGEKYKKSEHWRAVLAGDRKLIHQEEDGRWELYDLTADPAEQSPLIATGDEEKARLRALLAAWHTSVKAVAAAYEAGGEADLSPDDVKRLRGLGYVK